MANSGVDQVQINELERALSSDVNALQNNISRAMLEIFRFQIGYDRQITGVSASRPGGFRYEAPPEASQPQFTRVLGGLLVNPQTASILIDAGALMTVNPTPTAAESAMTLATSSGVSDAARFPFIPNAGPGPRWDIIECQPAEVTTSGTVDIFDSVTQQFQAQSVPKSESTGLDFQYNQGTAASPATKPTQTAGWQPLCLVWVPSTATNFDECEFFDVRPVLAGLKDPAGFGVRSNTLNEGEQSFKTNWRAINNSPTSGAFAGLNFAVVTGTATIEGLLQDQFDYENDQFATFDAYNQFGKKGYSAKFWFMNTQPGGSIEGAGPTFFQQGAEEGDVNEVGQLGNTLSATSSYRAFGVNIPWGYAGFFKYTNYTLNGRRWPMTMPGVFTVAEAFSASAELGKIGVTAAGNFSGSLPAAYDTVLAGECQSIIFGEISFTTKSNPLGGTDIMALSGEHWMDDEGWLYSDQGFDTVGATTATDAFLEWDFSSVGTPNWLGNPIEIAFITNFNAIAGAYVSQFLLNKSGRSTVNTGTGLVGDTKSIRLAGHYNGDLGAQQITTSSAIVNTVAGALPSGNPIFQLVAQGQGIIGNGFSANLQVMRVCLMPRNW